MRFNKYIAILSLTFVCTGAVAQENQFAYKRKINGAASEEWYAIALPPDLFKYCENDFRDLRIFNLGETDTAETPYLLDILDTEVKMQEVTLSPINESRSGNEYFLTFSNSGYQVNYLELDFEETNYFATVRIEGTNDKKKWFELAKNEKIFSVQNPREQYASSIINFPLTDYKFLRLAISSVDKLTFSSATFRLDEVKPGVFEDIPSSFSVSMDKKSKRTVIDVRLDDYRPVSNITLEIPNQNDFYRHITVETLADSSKTERGWLKNYRMISGNLITSFKANQFSIPFTLTNRLRLTIENFDNPPLSISAIKLNGAKVQLRAKLKGGNPFLFYGNPDIYRPTYDIEHFKEKIPMQLTAASLGPQENIGKAATPISALFENKAWLWAILLAVIAILGFFTLRMMKTKAA
ncbi:MAG TPA: DUF3999 family protein [Chryseosolibacter sp.]